MGFWTADSANSLMLTYIDLPTNSLLIMRENTLCRYWPHGIWHSDMDGDRISVMLRCISLANLEAAREYAKKQEGKEPQFSVNVAKIEAIFREMEKKVKDAHIAPRGCLFNQSSMNGYGLNLEHPENQAIERPNDESVDQKEKDDESEGEEE